MSKQAERMSAVDTAWLRMDSDANLKMIVGVWVLEPGVDYGMLCQRVQARLLKYRRFRQKVVDDPAGARWVLDKDFDIGRHVVRETLPVRRSRHPQRALEDRVAALATQPLDPQRPLWQLHLVERYQGGSVLIARIHHCIADGMALISVLLSIADGGKLPTARQRRAKDDADWLSEAFIRPLADTAVKALGGEGRSADQMLEWLREPSKDVTGSIALARVAVQAVSDAASFALMPDDAKTSLKGKPGRVKRVAWCEPIPLDDVKVIGKVLGASINDVLLACVAGAIGGYLRERGEDTDGKDIRAMVPVNLRPPDTAHLLGNRFGLVPLILPIGIANPVQRVAVVRGRMEALKAGYQPLLGFGLLAVAGLLIKPVQAALLNTFSKKVTAMITNVPGPSEPLKFCGATLKQVMFWVPQSGDIGIGVSILSYAGGVQFGLITDRKLCPDPERIIECFAPEFDKLLMQTMMLPWG